MTGEIIAIDSEADIRISREVVDAVKGKLTESNLGMINTHNEQNWYYSSYSVLNF